MGKPLWLKCQRTKEEIHVFKKNLRVFIVTISPLLACCAVRAATQPGTATAHVRKLTITNIKGFAWKLLDKQKL